jgi:hypothetical protein
MKTLFYPLYLRGNYGRVRIWDLDNLLLLIFLHRTTAVSRNLSLAVDCIQFMWLRFQVQKINRLSL